MAKSKLTMNKLADALQSVADVLEDLPPQVLVGDMKERCDAAVEKIRNLKE